MDFHISSIKLDVIVDGWGNTLSLTDAELVGLQNMALYGNSHKKVDVPLSMDMAGVVYNGVLPVTLSSLRGQFVSMELPSVIEMHNEGRVISVQISKSTFGFIDLRSVEYGARIIPTAAVSG